MCLWHLRNQPSNYLYRYVCVCVCCVCVCVCLRVCVCVTALAVPVPNLTCFRVFKIMCVSVCLCAGMCVCVCSVWVSVSQVKQLGLRDGEELERFIVKFRYNKRSPQDVSVGGSIW